MLNSPKKLSTKREIKTPRSLPKLNNPLKTLERKRDAYMPIDQRGMSSITSSLMTQQSGRNNAKHTDTINRVKDKQAVYGFLGKTFSEQSPFIPRIGTIHY